MQNEKSSASITLRSRLVRLFLVGALLTGLLLTTNCSTAMHQQTVPNASYLAAVQASDPAKQPHLADGSPELEQAIGRVKALFENYTADYISAHFDEVYAPSLYFRDAFKEFERREDIKEYLLHGLEALRSCTFTFDHAVTQRGEVFLHWTMHVSLKRDKEGVIDHSMGISHMRFDTEGRVIFHQDYWDPTDVVYRRIPIVNRMLAWVKGRL